MMATKEKTIRFEYDPEVQGCFTTVGDFEWLKALPFWLKFRMCRRMLFDRRVHYCNASPTVVVNADPAIESIWAREPNIQLNVRMGEDEQRVIEIAKDNVILGRATLTTDKRDRLRNSV
jgi:hypothetical protein